MGLDAQATVRSTGNPVVIDIAGDDLGLLIGRHGETLELTPVPGQRDRRQACTPLVQGDRRCGALPPCAARKRCVSLANRQASRVRQTQHEIALDPMPAAERRVVHMALQNSPWVVTNSVGEEPNRHVVIAPRQGAR